jgi:hypothetical protein
MEESKLEGFFGYSLYFLINFVCGEELEIILT